MDRKAWIILILCSLGLMANFYFNSKNKADVEPKKAPIEQPAGDLASSEGAEPGLVKTPAPEPTQKDQPFELVTKNEKGEDVALYTFTSFGGGIDNVELLTEKDVARGRSPEEVGHVKLNDRSDHPIGALATKYNAVESDFYQKVAGGQPGDQFVSYQLVKGDLTITKNWKLVSEGEGQPYRLLLDVTFKNTGTSTAHIGQYTLYSGSVAPLFTKELQDKAGWFYYADNEFEFASQKPFSGGWFSKGKSSVGEKVDNLEYFGVNNQFFTTLIRPLGDSAGEGFWATGEEVDLGDNEKGKTRWVFTMGLEMPSKALANGESFTVSYDLFMGPKQREIVKKLSENSDSAMNYGWFTVIAKVMSWGLNGIHGWFNGAVWAWGAAIILLTIFIRIVIWPLHNKSTRTMKRMSKLQPEMKEMKEKYADNPQKMNQEMMKLYRKYGVNPMGGCLPMLIQIPIFFGVFKMLGTAAELRGQSFLWVDDLSLPDTVYTLPVFGGVPINLLPILMAVTMVLQMRMTPQTGDKMQRTIFMFMPLMFFFFCYNYASALALYWTTQNIVSIGQTYLMKKLPEPELKEKGGKGGDDGKPRKKGFAEKLAEKLEEAQRIQEAKAASQAASKPKKR